MRELVGFISYPILMIVARRPGRRLVVGLLLGASPGIFGRMHAEQAFAALRIKNYKNFLRLKFEPDKLTIYPLGIDKSAGARPLVECTARQGQSAAAQSEADCRRSRSTCG